MQSNEQQDQQAARTGECPQCKWVNGHRSWCSEFTLMSEDGRTAFLERLRDFTNAGHMLIEVWADADEVAPLPDRLKPPLSLDEWLMELSDHYAVALAEQITVQDDDEITDGLAELPEWKRDGDPCNDCGQAANYDPANGWYYHVDPTVPGCFLMGSGPIEGTNDPMTSTYLSGNTRRGPARPANEQAAWRANAALARSYDAEPKGKTMAANEVDPDLRSPGRAGREARAQAFVATDALEAAEVAAGQPYLTDPDAAWKEAEAHMAALDLEIDDPRMGTRYIDLGKKVFGLLSWDGEYLIGLYFRTEDGDDGGVCARFDDWASTIAFVLRLIATQG